MNNETTKTKYVEPEVKYENPVTIEQLNLDIQQVKHTLTNIEILQEQQLVEMKKARSINYKVTSELGNKLILLLFLGILSGSGAYIYSRSEVAQQDNLIGTATDLVQDLLPYLAVGGAGLSAFSYRQNNRKLSDDNDSNL